MFQYRLTAEGKKYGTIFLIGILGFGLAVLALMFMFRTDHKIHLSKDFVEFGEEVRVAELVDQIGDVKISESMRHSSNTIVMDEYEVTFGTLDTSSLGEKFVEAQFSDENIEPVTLHFQVVDTTSPVIRVERPNEIRKYTLEEIEDKKYLSEFKIQDSCTPFSKLDIEGSLVNREAKTGDQTKIEIVVVDESGNIATASLPIEINDEPKKEEEDKEEEDSESSSEHSEDSKPSKSDVKPAESEMNNPVQSNPNPPSSSSKPKPTTPSVQPTPPAYPPVQTPQPPVVEEPFDPAPVNPPADQYFWFEDGYDMNNVSSACQAALNSSGWNGACVPIQDEDGIYLGMKLTFY